MTAVLPMYVVYDHPLDFPDLFVVRRRDISPGCDTPTDKVWTCPEIEPLRAWLRGEGMTCLPRDPADDPVIVETWV